MTRKRRGAPRLKKARRTKLQLRNGAAEGAASQLREDADADFHDLVADSEGETHDFEIALEIAEMRADESRRRSRSVLRETPLALWCQRNRKGAQP